MLGVSGPITLASGELAISADGTVSVGGGVAGKLRISEFSSADALTPAGENYYSAAKGTDKPATASAVRQGMLESSNVNPVAAMVGLITAQRQAEMIGRAMTAFDSTFNRIAVDELPRAT